MLFNLALFLLTIAGGLLPLWMQSAFSDRRMQLLLAFSGSFLLGITFLHLLPETFAEEFSRTGAPTGKLPVPTGLLILVGFFFQLLIQRFTHGLEHGHTHVHPAGTLPLTGIITGLTIHAFMEGMPLGFNYREAATEPSLYLAVAAHKLPEAMLLTLLVLSARGRKAAALTLVLFACVTPVAAFAATRLGHHYHAMAKAVTVVIPIVAGAFIHIATTIFFESGTRQHMLTRQKVAAMAVGIGCALATLLFE